MEIKELEIKRAGSFEEHSGQLVGKVKFTGPNGDVSASLRPATILLILQAIHGQVVATANTNAKEVSGALQDARAQLEINAMELRQAGQDAKAKALPTLDELKSNCIVTTYNCWLWTKSTANGYANIRSGGKLYKCHRLAYTYTKGYIPEDVLLRHTCNHKNCINPEHLILGTKSENAKDYFKLNSPQGGVHKSGNGYRAKITIDGNCYRKFFLCEQDAFAWLQHFKDGYNG